MGIPTLAFLMFCNILHTYWLVMLDINGKQLQLDFQVTPSLIAGIHAIAESDWIAHVNQANYSGDWQVYPLRGLAKYQCSSPILQGFALEESTLADDFSDYASMAKFPEIMDFLRQLACPILSARLMRLRPGAVINLHRDRGICIAEGQARLHLSLQTDPSVEFVVAGESIQMAEGELWYLNADLEHAVYHRGQRDRIHLVIDCVANDWLRLQLGLQTTSNIVQDLTAE